MSDHAAHLERAQFLAVVKDLGKGDEVQAASLDLMVEIVSQTPAPWADSNAFAAERYLASRGASPAAASRNAAEFEVAFRAIVALCTGKPVQAFSEIADWIDTHVDGPQ